MCLQLSFHKLNAGLKSPRLSYFFLTPFLRPNAALVSGEEMAGKIKAALDARSDPATVIMVRTDSVARLSGRSQDRFDLVARVDFRAPGNSKAAFADLGSPSY